jgi:hypothetical protein
MRMKLTNAGGNNRFARMVDTQVSVRSSELVGLRSQLMRRVAGQPLLRLVFAALGGHI